LSSEKSELEKLFAKLDKALLEARDKTERAATSTTKTSQDYEKEIWAAAEACEYACLMYVLTYNIEGTNASPPSKVEDLDVSKALSQTILTLERTLADRQGKGPILDGYKLLRRDADLLRSSYLSMTRPKQKPDMQNKSHVLGQT
jgi:hypothetical protein